jgi:hypothetical protein
VPSSAPQRHSPRLPVVILTRSDSRIHSQYHLTAGFSSKPWLLILAAQKGYVNFVSKPVVRGAAFPAEPKPERPGHRLARREIRHMVRPI